ncbi:protein trichome birefringence-like 19 [Lolium rigidum]|uniref:protein trichome birefringence-like 19 n=1 Tax=Lolium rigidum TaxID=89674 RepID=UPI001F5C9A88|nr:protein trichome birefringence-like 19 [Lolium rigidum]
MKQLDGIAIPYWQYVFPAAVLTTCLVILAAVSLPGRSLLILPAVTSRTEGPGGNRSSCNLFKGDWVPDHGAPSYTNETCPVIHGHYDCMRYGKPDLEFLRWRWQPEGCELPRFDAARFLGAMRGKSVAFVGDSLARNQMHSLVCLLSRAERPVPWTNGGYLYRYERHGFTVADFWSPFLVRAAETDPDGPARNGAGLWSLHLDEPDPGWAAHVSKFDVVVVSAGSWFYRPSVFYERGRVVGCSGCLAPNVTDLTLRYSLRAAFRSALRAAVGASSGTGTVVVRTVSPAHYENGTWNDNGDCVRTRPLRRGEWEMERLHKEMRRIQVEEFAAADVAARGKGVRMLLMDATEAMAMRPDAHPGKYRLWQPDKFRVSRDCVHWCLPGAMDVCNDMLLHMLID